MRTSVTAWGVSPVEMEKLLSFCLGSLVTSVEFLIRWGAKLCKSPNIFFLLVSSKGCCSLEVSRAGFSSWSLVANSNSHPLHLGVGKSELKKRSKVGVLWGFSSCKSTSLGVQKTTAATLQLSQQLQNCPGLTSPTPELKSLELDETCCAALQQQAASIFVGSFWLVLDEFLIVFGFFEI